MSTATLPNSLASPSVSPTMRTSRTQIDAEFLAHRVLHLLDQRLDVGGTRLPLRVDDEVGVLLDTRAPPICVSLQARRPRSAAPRDRPAGCGTPSRRWAAAAAGWRCASPAARVMRPRASARVARAAAGTRRRQTIRPHRDRAARHGGSRCRTRPAGARAARRAGRASARVDDAPGLAAVAAGVHRQRAAHGARNAGEEFRAGEPVVGGEARHLGAGDAGLGVDAGPSRPRCSRPSTACRSTTVPRSRRRAPAGCCPGRRSSSGSSARAGCAGRRAQVVEVGGTVGARRRAAGAPADVPRHRLVEPQLAAQRLAPGWSLIVRPCVHSRQLPAGTPPIEPAPMVTTTSPSRATCEDRRGHVGDVLDEHRLDLAGDAHRARQRAAVRRDDRRLAGRVDLGQQQRVDRRTAPCTKSSNRSRVRV